MILRPETPHDYSQIADITYESFSSWAERPFRGEPCLVDALRSDQYYDPELSLVAEENGRIVGHAFYHFFPAIVLGEERMGAYLAPLTVAPGHQRQGIGRRLLQEGARIAREKGLSFLILCGHPDYYSKFGYQGHAFALQGCVARPSAPPVSRAKERPVRQSDLPWLTRRWKELHMSDRLALYPGDLAVQWFSHSPKCPASVFFDGDEILGYARYSGEQIKELVPLGQHASAILHQITGDKAAALPFFAAQAAELGLSAQEAVVTSPAYCMLNLNQDPLICRYLEEERPGVIAFPSALDLDE